MAYLRGEWGQACSAQSSSAAFGGYDIIRKILGLKKKQYVPHLGILVAVDGHRGINLRRDERPQLTEEQDKHAEPARELGIF